MFFSSSTRRYEIRVYSVLEHILLLACAQSTDTYNLLAPKVVNLHWGEWGIMAPSGHVAPPEISAIWCCHLFDNVGTSTSAHAQTVAIWRQRVQSELFAQSKIKYSIHT